MISQLNWFLTPKLIVSSSKHCISGRHCRHEILYSKIIYTKGLGVILIMSVKCYRSNKVKKSGCYKRKNLLGKNERIGLRKK